MRGAPPALLVHFLLLLLLPPPPLLAAAPACAPLPPGCEPAADAEGQARCRLRVRARVAEPLQLWLLAAPPLDVELQLTRAPGLGCWVVARAGVRSADIDPDTGTGTGTGTGTDLRPLLASPALVQLLRGLRGLRAEVVFPPPTAAAVRPARPSRLTRLTHLEAQCEDDDALDSAADATPLAMDLRFLLLRGCYLNNKNLHYFLGVKQPYLHTLHLINCGLTDLQNDIFDATLHVTSLSLSDNLLSFIPSSISRLKEVFELDLSGNPLHLTEANLIVLLSLRRLKLLYLQRISLTSLQVLQPVLNSSDTQLTVLGLSQCNLTQLLDSDIKLFRNQKFLHTLDFHNNNFSTLPANWTSLPDSVHVLNLSSNHLTDSQFQFSASSKLDVLDLSDNKFTCGQDIVISGHVSVLNLSHNLIISLNESCFNNTDMVNISYNSICMLTETAILSFDTLAWVDLGENPFDCASCSILLVQEWLNKERRVQVLGLNVNDSLLCLDHLDPKQRVSDVILDTKCEEEIYVNVFTRSVPVLMVVSSIVLIAVLLYGYRFETSFLLRLLNIKIDNEDSLSPLQCKYDAFICYSNGDRDWVVEQLIPKLEGSPHHYVICEHERDFMLGSLITHNVVRSMQLSRHIILVLSNNFLKSQWCTWELEMARHKQFEEGSRCLVLVYMPPLERKALPQDLRVVLESQPLLQAPGGAGLWERLPQLLGPSLASAGQLPG